MIRLSDVASAFIDIGRAVGGDPVRISYYGVLVYVLFTYVIGHAIAPQLLAVVSLWLFLVGAVGFVAVLELSTKKCWRTIIRIPKWDKSVRYLVLGAFSYATWGNGNAAVLTLFILGVLFHLAFYAVLEIKANAYRRRVLAEIHQLLVTRELEKS